MRRIVVLICCCLAAVAAGAGEKNLTLSEVIERTLQHHPEIQQARYRYEEADAGIAVARSALFPQLNLEANVGTFHDRVANPGEDIIPLVGRDRNRYVGKLVLVQPIFHGFGLWNGITASKKRAETARAALENTISATLLRTLRAYFEIQVMRDELQARREAKAFHENQLHQTELRFNQGRATKLQLLEARYVAGTEEPRIETLQGEIENRILDLAGTLSLESPQDYHFTDSLEKAMELLQESTLPAAEEAVKLLSEKNPQLRQARLEVETKEAQTGLDFSDDLPSLDLHLAAGTDSYLRQDIASSDTLFYSGELRLKIPLFSGLSSLHERRAARAQVSAQKRERERVEQDSLKRLLASYHNWKVASTRIRVAKKEVEFMEEKLSQTRRQLAAGRSTLSDMLEAYSELLDAKKGRGDAVVGKILAVTEIRGLLGWFSRKQSEDASE